MRGGTDGLATALNDGASPRRWRWYAVVLVVLCLVAGVALNARRHANGATASSEPPPPGPTSSAPPTPCQEALAWVAGAGLQLPPGAGYHCPSTEFPHNGAACWHSPGCPTDGFIAINTELMGTVTPEYFRHVVAHEVCHLVQFQATGVSSEAEADECAAAHGAPG